MIKVVSNRADQAIAVSRDSFQRAPEERIGFARAVNIGGEEGPDPFFVGEMDEIDETLIGQRFTKVHETSGTPHSESGPGQLHRPKR